MSKHLSRRQALKLSAASLAALGATQDPAFAKNAPPSAPAESGTEPAAIEVDRVHSTVDGLLASSGLPGLSIAVIDRGRVSAFRGFGCANPATGGPVTESTVFQAASLTKPTFAYVVLKLCEEGRLNLDAPLMRRYLPEVAPSRDPAADAITARLVLSHASGLPITHFPKFPEKMDFEPGTRFGYSGAAYIYLQKVVEKVLDMPLLGIMNRYVVQPLGWTDSAYVWRPEYETGAAIACDFDNTPVRAEERSRPEQACSAASLHSTPKEYARFMAELLFQPNGALKLKYPLRRMMLSPQVMLNDSVAWGLGWGLHLSDDGDRFWHWGDSRGYMSYAVGSLSRRRGVVIFTNGRNGLRVAEQVAAKVMEGGESDTFSWIYDGFYAENDAPLPPLPTDGGHTAPAPPVRKAGKTGQRGHRK